MIESSTHNIPKNSLSLPAGESHNITSRKTQVLIQEKANIIVSDKVFDKIKYLCTRYKEVEWSGLIWMDVEGSVEDPTNLKINIIDFTLFDIGSHAYTEFEVDPEIIMGVYNKYPEYINKKYGCLHSHNTMNVFFSGTDTSTLLEQAYIHNFFVSLIINNKFEKISKISYKGKKTTTEKFFNRIGKIMLPFTRNVEEEVAYVIDCDVKYETEYTDTQDTELLNQIEILDRKEEEKKKRRTIHSTNSKIGRPFWEEDVWDYMKDSKPRSHGFKVKEKQLPIFSQEKIEVGRSGFSNKCEAFVKQLMLIDHSGDETAMLTLEETRNSRKLWYDEVPVKEYLEELTEWCDTLVERTFQKEICANIFEEDKFKKLTMMISSECYKFLDFNSPIERNIIEIIDKKLKDLSNERQEGRLI